MEVTQEIQREYNSAHPNYNRWQKARDLSEHRAEFVKTILSKEIVVEGLKILDIGAGEGSTSKLLSQKNYVVSLEPKAERIKKIQSSDSLFPIIGDSRNFPLRNSKFDLIILQDVIEHFDFSRTIVDSLKDLLNEQGLIYLSTPNKFSILNIISDPHWGMPLLCLFNREQIKKFFLKYFRKSDYNRDDIAQLLSLKDLNEFFSNHFLIKICTKTSVEYLFNGGKGIVWSNFHLFLIRLINMFGFSSIIKRVSNDHKGFINKFLTPTFFLLLKKK